MPTCHRYFYLHTLVLSLFIGAIGGHDAGAQLSAIRADIQNTLRYDDRSRISQSPLERTYSQRYRLDVDGYVYSPKLLTFTASTSYVREALQFRVADRPVQKRDFSDWGLFELSATLFPNNGFRLRGFLHRHDMTSAQSGADALTPGWSAVNDTRVQRYGIDMHIPGNTFYPRVDLLVTRDLLKCITVCDEQYRRDDLVILRLGNSANNGASYAADYRGMFRRDFTVPGASDEHQILITGRSEMAGAMTVNVTGQYQARAPFSNHSVDVIGDYGESERARHRVRATATGNRLSSALRQQGTEYQFEHRSFLSLSSSMRASAGMGGNVQSATNGIDQQSADRSFVALDGMYNAGSEALHYELSASVEAALVKKFGMERGYFQASKAGGGIAWNASEHGMVTLRSDIAHEYSQNGDDALRNDARIEGRMTTESGLILAVRATRSDVSYTGSQAFIRSAVTGFEGEANINGLSFCIVNLLHSERWSSAVFSDRSSLSKAELLIPRLLRNLDLRFNAQRTASSLTGFQTYLLEGELRYRFHSFLISARVQRNLTGRLVSDYMVLDFRRPIDIFFR
ncbi:MAG: hypothetical protein HY962_11020 [Ignavibacteriae bacterium]|nr:hypothetical protein [Ignavibacteriota bacterium]